MKYAMGCSVVLEQHTDGLSVMDSADGFGENGGNFENLELGAQPTMLVLRDRVGDHNLVNGRSIDASNGISTEDTMGEQSVYSSSALTLEKLGGSGNGVARVDDVINQDAHTIGNVTNKHHAGISVFGELDRASFLGFK